MTSWRNLQHAGAQVFQGEVVSLVFEGTVDAPMESGMTHSVLVYLALRDMRLKRCMLGRESVMRESWSSTSSCQFNS